MTIIGAGLTLLDVRPLTPEITIICTGLILLLLDLVVKKKEAIAFVGILGTIVAIFATYRLYGFTETQSIFTSMFVLDGYANFFKIIFYINVILTICISVKYMKIEKASFGEYYALLLVAGEIGKQRHIRQIPRALARHLHQINDLSVAHPVRLGQLPAQPLAGPAVNLAVLDRQPDWCAAAIPADDLELGAQHVLHQAGNQVGAGGLADCAKDQPFLYGFLEGLGRRVAAHGQCIDRLAPTAEPVQLDRIVFGLADLEQDPLGDAGIGCHHNRTVNDDTKINCP